MKTVGSILKEARVGKRFSLEYIEQATKIRIKFLQAIERDDFSGLPSVAYAKGFVKNYADFLGVSSETVLAFFRRQTKDATKSSLLPKGMAEPLNYSMLRLTPSRFLSLIIGGLVLVFLTYFSLQYYKLQTPPGLIVESPTDNTTIAETRVDVFGKTDPDATISINSIGVLVRSDGKFFDQVALNSGINTVVIIATSRYGKTKQVIRTVMQKSP